MQRQNSFILIQNIDYYYAATSFVWQASDSFSHKLNYGKILQK